MKSAILCAYNPHFTILAGRETAYPKLILFNLQFPLEAEERQFPYEHLSVRIQVDLNEQMITSDYVESVDLSTTIL